MCHTGYGHMVSPQLSLKLLDHTSISPRLLGRGGLFKEDPKPQSLLFRAGGIGEPMNISQVGGQ